MFVCTISDVLLFQHWNFVISTFRCSARECMQTQYIQAIPSQRNRLNIQRILLLASTMPIWFNRTKHRYHEDWQIFFRYLASGVPQKPLSIQRQSPFPRHEVLAALVVRRGRKALQMN